MCLPFIHHIEAQKSGLDIIAPGDMSEGRYNILSPIKEKEMSDNEEKGGSIFQKMKGRAKEMQADLAEKITQASEAGSNKLRETVEELNEILPVVHDLGYAVDGITVGVGLIPDIAIDISGLSKKMDEETYQRILKEKEDKKLLCAVLRTLQTSSGLHDKIHISGMKSDSATISLTLPPKINLKFKKI